MSDTHSGTSHASLDFCMCRGRTLNLIRKGHQPVQAVDPFRKINVVNNLNPGFKILCVLYRHYNVALTFK